jgi:hypothetical protein
MGYELYRMIRDGAPADWTPAMRQVAQAIADDARDPRQRGGDDDGGWPWSAITIGGEWRKGKWHDGLTQRTGLTPKGISRILTMLSHAGFEMRQQIATDKRGRPVFAYPGHRTRFHVPPLPPREPPVVDESEHHVVDESEHHVVDESEHHVVPRNDPNGAQKSHPMVDESEHPVPPLVPPLSYPPPHPQAVNSSLEGDRDGQGDDDDDDQSEAEFHLPGHGQCTVCGGWFSVGASGHLVNHGTGLGAGRRRRAWCEGSRQPPAEPVPCRRCRRTDVVLGATTGLCQPCRRAEAEAEADSEPDDEVPW